MEIEDPTRFCVIVTFVIGYFYFVLWYLEKLWIGKNELSKKKKKIMEVKPVLFVLYSIFIGGLLFCCLISVVYYFDISTHSSCMRNGDYVRPFNVLPSPLSIVSYSPSIVISTFTFCSFFYTMARFIQAYLFYYHIIINENVNKEKNNFHLVFVVFEQVFFLGFSIIRFKDNIFYHRFCFFSFMVCSFLQLMVSKNIKYYSNNNYYKFQYKDFQTTKPLFIYHLYNQRYVVHFYLQFKPSNLY